MALTRPTEHRGRSYTLTGPKPVPWTEVAETLSVVLGRRIAYTPASIPACLGHLRRRGLPFGAILVQTTLHVLLRFGQGAPQDPTLARLLGRPGLSIQQYIRDHAQLWTKPP